MDQRTYPKYSDIDIRDLPPQPTTQKVPTDKEEVPPPMSDDDLSEHEIRPDITQPQPPAEA